MQQDKDQFLEMTNIYAMDSGGPQRILVVRHPERAEAEFGAERMGYTPLNHAFTAIWLTSAKFGVPLEWL
jgi:hypothetical protein